MTTSAASVTAGVEYYINSKRLLGFSRLVRIGLFAESFFISGRQRTISRRLGEEVGGTGLVLGFRLARCTRRVGANSNVTERGAFHAGGADRGLGRRVGSSDWRCRGCGSGCSRCSGLVGIGLFAQGLFIRCRERTISWRLGEEIGGTGLVTMCLLLLILHNDLSGYIRIFANLSVSITQCQAN